VGVIRSFIAQHHLIGGDWGRENQHHSHAYKLEVVFEGDELDRHGYLVDIAEVKRHLDRLIDRYADRSLNDLPELEGKNPGLEPFARVLGERLAEMIGRRTLSAISVKLWENEEAFATYRVSFRG
jgi:6-pyruvoyltetrahydropterin/6-carboxytetrahydropterin synthase